MARCDTCGNEAGLKHNTPFVCPECGGIKFPFKAIRDIVFIWPDPLPEKLSDVIIVPEKVRDRLQEEVDVGTVVSVGPGYWDKKKKKFVYTLVKVGQRVVYDAGCPWWQDVEVGDKKYEVRLMGEKDIKGVIYE